MKNLRKFDIYDGLFVLIKKWKEHQMIPRLPSAAFDPGSPNALLHARPNPPLNSEVGRLPVGLHIIQFKPRRAAGQRKASLTSCPVILTIYRLFRSDLISQERRERKNTTGRTQSINYICWHVRFGFSCWKREPRVSRFCGGGFSGDARRCAKAEVHNRRQGLEGRGGEVDMSN